MRALVTGAGGFIGSHLTETLTRLGHFVTAMVHYRGDGHRGWLEDSLYRNDMEIVAGDVCDPDAVRRLVCSRPFDTIFNLAALISIPHSYECPERFLATNAGGCLNVLNAARHTCRIVQMSTSEVYGTGRELPMTESHPLNAQSPYAASKTAADQLALAFSRSFDTDVVIARPFNTYGPRQSVRAVIPNVIAQALRGANEIEVGTITATRDFTYVQDTVDALVLLGACPGIAPGPWNIGSGNPIPIGALVHRIGRLLSRDLEPVVVEQYVRPERSEVQQLHCDSSRLRSTVEWEPKCSLDEGLQQTIQWIEGRLHAVRKGRVT